MKDGLSPNSKVSYDFESDIFYIIPMDRVYASSFQMGDIIFDIDDKNRISGIEILNASKMFNVQKVFLKNNISGRLELDVSDDLIKLKLSLTLIIRNSSKTSSLNLERVRPEFVQNSQLNLAIV
jgi:uncharacterized protein YuzE